MDGLEVHPLTPDRWDDLVALFGPNGAYSGCWCMWPGSRVDVPRRRVHRGRPLVAVPAGDAAGPLAGGEDAGLALVVHRRHRPIVLGCCRPECIQRLRRTL